MRAVLEWCKQPVSIPEWAVVGTARGFSRDQSFNQHRPFHLAWLIEYLIHWHELTENEKEELLVHPARFADDVHSFESLRGAYQPMQEAWLYINFPESFENISSRKDKQRIWDAFYKYLVNGPTKNVDADIQEIRTQLTKEVGDGFHFYRSPIVERWQEAQISGHDIELIRLSRTKDRYTDFSAEEQTAYKRVHEALRRLGDIAISELGGTRDYVLKLTSGFHPASGIRGGKPKDLWFGVYRKENEERFLGNPQDLHDCFE